MFRMKITFRSISHSNYFSPLHQKNLYNVGTKPFKRNLWHSLLDPLLNFRYAKYYLARNVAAEAFQVLLNLKVLKPETSLHSAKLI